MNQLFLLSASLCAGTCLALTDGVMKSYRIVNHSDGAVMVNIGTPKTIKGNEVVARYSESFLLDSGQNNLKSGQIRSFQDSEIQDLFYIEASSSLMSFSPLHSPSYQAFNVPQNHDRILCIIDRQVNVDCTFHPM